MTEEEELAYAEKIITSPDFMQAFMEMLNNVDKGEVNLHHIASWFYSRGYFACLAEGNQGKSYPYVKENLQ